MYPSKQMFLRIFLIGLQFYFCHADRVYFSKCNVNGFKCVTKANKKIDLFYECPKGVNTVTIFINQFSSPANTERLTIANCHELNLSTRCSGENKPIQYLKVANVTKLTFQRLQYEPMLPPDVVFENIHYVETIPTETFGQVVKNLHSVGCVLPSKDFESIEFRNVSIGTIQSGAFVAANEFRNFSFVNVSVGRLESSGIDLKLESKGEFRIDLSRFEVVEHLGFKVTSGKQLTISNSEFHEINSGGVNGTVENFYFVHNFVNTLQPQGFSILATNVYILENKFMYLKSGALEKVGPGLIEATHRNFGKLKFVYDFSKNVVNFVDAGSLHPDLTAYDNVGTEMLFAKNDFYCSCENLGWLFSNLGHGMITDSLTDFYETVLKNDDFGNVCTYTSCNLTLNAVTELISDGKCVQGHNMDRVCFERTYTPTTDVQENTLGPERLVDGNSSATSDVKSKYYFVPFLLSIFCSLSF